MNWAMAGMHIYNQALPVHRASWTDGQYLQFYDQVPVGANVDGLTITRTEPGYMAGLYEVYDTNLRSYTPDDTDWEADDWELAVGL